MYSIIKEIIEDPYSYKELKGQLKNLRSARFGDFRIIYRINERQEIVELITVGHSHVY
jgi:mRNA-degrading endonuclease RelE of RelBE toxin-antitoxin system